MLDFLTFTGVDSETPMKDLLSIAQSYGKSHVEFGVLVGSHTGESDHGIFPPLHVVHAVRKPQYVVNHVPVGMHAQLQAPLFGLGTLIWFCASPRLRRVELHLKHGLVILIAQEFQETPFSLESSRQHAVTIGTLTRQAVSRSRTLDYAS